MLKKFWIYNYSYKYTTLRWTHFTCCKYRGPHVWLEHWCTVHFDKNYIINFCNRTFTCIAHSQYPNCVSGASKSILNGTDVFSKKPTVFNSNNKNWASVGLLWFRETVQSPLIFFPSESNRRFSLSRTQKVHKFTYICCYVITRHVSKYTWRTW